MSKNNLAAGNPQMANIDGGKVRRIREERGLTQLYLATFVGVTTDTISRWENRRYPTIKKENALKLAEALEVGLEEILEQGPPEEIDPRSIGQPRPDPVSGNKTVSTASRSPYRLLVIPLIAGVLLLVAWWFYSSSQPPRISATRILPAHVPPGQPFPVIIKISSTPPGPVSLILKETLPPGCEALQGRPLFTASNRGTGVIKWISKINQPRVSFFYLARTSSSLKPGSSLRFNGALTFRGGRGKTLATKGNNRIVTEPFHWADTNSDHSIDDEEILSVYEVYGGVEGLIDIDRIEEIWSGSGYRWDAEKQQYIVIP